MRCLWLTLADPEPQHNGQFIYSGGLIDSFAGAGAEVDALGLSRTESHRYNGLQEGRITWWLAKGRPLSHWTSVRSCLPTIATRCRIPEMQSLLAARLDEGKWDVIVFDGLSSVWALDSVLRLYPDAKRRPKIVYISHNHEESLCSQLTAVQPHFVKRQAMRLDWLKTAMMERALVRAADLVTAITPEDYAVYHKQWPSKRIEVLTPGYGGRAVLSRQITEDIPRRAVIVGSFDWVAKRLNLEEFVNAADSLFTTHGIQLQVIGSGDEGFFRVMQDRTAATQFTGTVETIETYLDQARIAIVPERAGGGFKLKVLEYVFNRLPVLAIKGSAAGVPLTNNESILLYPGQKELADGVMRSIDNLEQLNRLHNAAFRACSDRFDWASRGNRLASAVGSL
jgi:glycosyltransferase involved in cell wall biosynthesis